MQTTIEKIKELTKAGSIKTKYSYDAATSFLFLQYPALITEVTDTEVVTEFGRTKLENLNDTQLKRIAEHLEERKQMQPQHAQDLVNSKDLKAIKAAYAKYKAIEYKTLEDHKAGFILGTYIEDQKKRPIIIPLIEAHQVWLKTEGREGTRLEYPKGDKSLDFSDMNLAGYSFKDAILKFCRFNNCNLTGCSFEGANLEVSSFDTATLTDTNFEGAEGTIVQKIINRTKDRQVF
jgi:uncharacterized protein YjbI with pentapeptide repeats